MECFDWKVERSEVFGLVKRPVAEICLKDKEGEWQPILAYVDSGADITVLKRSFGELLGFDVESGREAEFGGVSGSKIKTYLHKVDLRIGSYERTATVAFSKDDRPPNLLGRIDIFTRFELHFRSRTEETCFISSG